MIETAYTFYFEEIFPNYNSWESFIKLSSDIVDYDNPEDATFDLFCFNLLFRHYNHTNIRYSSEQAFLSELLNVYHNKFTQFKREKELIQDIAGLTIEELQVVNTAITNMSNNPNVDVDDPTTPLKFISAQTYNAVKSNKLKAYLDALNNMPSLNVYKFFKANNKDEMGFDDLFMNVQPPIHYYYKKGDK